MKNSSSASGGIGFSGALAILFIGLKLTGHIDWSWPLVLSPLWVPLAVVLLFFCTIILAAIVKVLISLL